jgi:hypothetical protein
LVLSPKADVHPKHGQAGGRTAANASDPAKAQSDFNKKRRKPQTTRAYTGSELLYADILNMATGRRLIKYKLYH